jgi:hypothetical protein
MRRDRAFGPGRANGAQEKSLDTSLIQHPITISALCVHNFRKICFFSGYEQDAWVLLQRYRDAPWEDLIALWSSFNLHIARIMDFVPKDERDRLRARHNLDELAWKSVSRDQPATLDYFMRDYVAHLKHHLAQIGIGAA